MMQACLSKLGISVSSAFIAERDPTLAELQLAWLRAFRDSFFTLIYYSGHGREGDGAWWLQDSNEFVTPVALLEFWKNHKRQNCKLLIVSDSCFSGHWADRARQFEDVAVIAAATASEKAFDTASGGAFTSSLANAWSMMAEAQHSSAMAYAVSRFAGLPGSTSGVKSLLRLGSFMSKDQSSTTSWTPWEFDMLKTVGGMGIMFYGMALFVEGIGALYSGMAYSVLPFGSVLLAFGSQTNMKWLSLKEATLIWTIWRWSRK